jgi:hypothetical protein
MKKMSIQLIYGIVRAAERCGGIQNLEMVRNRKRWRDCVANRGCIGAGHLHFNNLKTHSTGIIKLP